MYTSGGALRRLAFAAVAGCGSVAGSGSSGGGRCDLAAATTRRWWQQTATAVASSAAAASRLPLLVPSILSCVSWVVARRAGGSAANRSRTRAGSYVLSLEPRRREHGLEEGF